MYLEREIVKATNDILQHRRLKSRLGRFHFSHHSMETLRYYGIRSFKNLISDNTIYELSRSSGRWSELMTFLLDWRASRDDDQVFREQKKEEPLSLQKGVSYWRGCRLTQLSWREVLRHRDPGRHRARHFVCRCRYRTEVFDDFRCHVSVSFIASKTFSRARRHWRRRHFVRLLSFDGWHILYCIAQEKGCCLQRRKSKRSRPYLQRFSFRAISESSLVRKRAWTMHLDVFISLCRSVCLHTSFENWIARISTSSFLAQFCKRDDRSIISSLSLSLSSSSLKEQCHDSRTQFLRVQDGDILANLVFTSSNFVCLRADSDPYDTFQISWNTARVTLICIMSSYPWTLRFAVTIVVVCIHDVNRNYLKKHFLQLSVWKLSHRDLSSLRSI